MVCTWPYLDITCNQQIQSLCSFCNNALVAAVPTPTHRDIWTWWYCVYCGLCIVQYGGATVVLSRLAKRCLDPKGVCVLPFMVIKPQSGKTNNSLLRLYYVLDGNCPHPPTPKSKPLDLVVVCVRWIVSCAIWMEFGGAYDIGKMDVGLHKEFELWPYLVVTPHTHHPPPNL